MPPEAGSCSVIEEPCLTAYLAAEECLDDLLAELGDADAVHGRLVLRRGPAVAAAWAQNVWFDARRLPIVSIGDAARQLRAIQRNWTLYSHAHYRRAALIVDKLPKVSAKPVAFGSPAPTAPLGAWTLLEPDLMLAASRCSSPFPHGEMQFVEDRLAPPSRAYLKLWEAFTLLGKAPRPGDRVVDLGSSPGGWSWVLQGLGAGVISVDKAPLDPRIASLPGIEYRAESAFALDPAALGPVDWVFSDVICYPSRLFGLIERWRAAGTCPRFLCTLKFQGATDHETARRFAAIPGSRLLHLHHNKHELTWILAD
jgi:23S rRNA (cytidine2498-2'-O)-methyltransferase